MDGYSSFGSGSGSPTVNSETIGETIKVLHLQAALQQQEMLVQTINDKCFKMCINNPGSSLDGSQQKCLSKCVDRYIDAWNCVSRTVTNKIRQQAQMM
ncbi:mitochondrial import inner membrane translocase subunit Tim13 [Ciona intestinalis]|uniref:Mitochondrial import inner membrane translocase subunit n=2 Tax=Ciona intestinalis TaxID=7719 RepID=H2Y167_CIOIN|nr:mitochondrial import inner membrane translocase subunit Tim13 [Ciona intestinalis]|eukprot:XP_002130093.1 mitochondrial import inner membrane translocase subunit Tim13 [Ciona intestinalis]